MTTACATILEPRMVALLEATMWREIRDPEFLLGALKILSHDDRPGAL